MARKRSIKPEFFSDIDLAEVSIEARFLYAGMWLWMDRQGVIEASPKAHRANVFPHDERVTANKVESWLNELVKARFVVRFTWQGKELLYCPTLKVHQKLFPDEKARFNVSDELLAKLENDALLPDTSTLSSNNKIIGSVSEPVRVRVEVEEKVEVKEEAQIFDFETLYKTWPRKRGKDEGMNRLSLRIKTKETFDQFTKAVHHAVLEFQTLKTEKRFIPYWSSFVGVEGREPWRDYIDRPDFKAFGEEAPEERIARMVRESEERKAKQITSWDETA